jgi:hypothetical protein
VIYVPQQRLIGWQHNAGGTNQPVAIGNPRFDPERSRGSILKTREAARLSDAEQGLVGYDLEWVPLSVANQEHAILGAAKTEDLSPTSAGDRNR